MTGEGLPAGEPSERPPIKALFLAANPLETSRLRLDREVRTIEEALRAAGSADRFKLEQAWAVTYSDLQDALLRHRPDLVHFSGHGSQAGELLVERERTYHRVRPAATSSGAEPAAGVPHSIEALGRLFAAAKGNIRCVVLNACHSLGQAQAIAEHVGCAIGMSRAIADEAAIRFSWALYHAIGRGESVKTAFDLARVQAELARHGQEDIPRLITPRIDPAHLVLASSAG